MYDDIFHIHVDSDAWHSRELVTDQQSTYNEHNGYNSTE